jgi:hypothetical protein
MEFKKKIHNQIIEKMSHSQISPNSKRITSFFLYSFETTFKTCRERMKNQNGSNLL